MQLDIWKRSPSPPDSTLHKLMVDHHEETYVTCNDERGGDDVSPGVVGHYAGVVGVVFGHDTRDRHGGQPFGHYVQKNPVVSEQLLTILQPPEGVGWLAPLHNTSEERILTNGQVRWKLERLQYRDP